jgi:hypothetical protein
VEDAWRLNDDGGDDGSEGGADSDSNADMLSMDNISALTTGGRLSKTLMQSSRVLRASPLSLDAQAHCRAICTRNTR